VFWPWEYLPSGAAPASGNKAGPASLYVSFRFDFTEMMNQLCEIGNFIRRLRVQLRFGELSREPLRLLRLEWRDDTAICDWIARSPDKWDKDLTRPMGEHYASVQALEDAIAVRHLLFLTLPDVSTAQIRVYRQPADQPPELIITGMVTRNERVPPHDPSLAMRAKLYGFQFRLEEGKLETLECEE